MQRLHRYFLKMTTKYKEIISKNYSSAILPDIKLIDGKYPYSRGYECLSFNGYLNLNFPNKIFFINNNQLNLLNDHLEELYPKLRNSVHKYEYLENNHLLPEVSQLDIQNLKFFQDEINIDRLDKLANEDNFLKPVLVVGFQNEFILLDGYHRTLISFLAATYIINCYII